MEYHSYKKKLKFCFRPCKKLNKQSLREILAVKQMTDSTKQKEMTITKDRDDETVRMDKKKLVNTVSQTTDNKE